MHFKSPTPGINLLLIMILQFVIQEFFFFLRNWVFLLPDWLLYQFCKAVDRWRTTLLYKNIYVFLFFRKGSKLLLWERQMELEGDKTDCNIDPHLLFLLTIAHCVIFKTPLSTSSYSRLGLLNRLSKLALTHRLQLLSRHLYLIS